MAKPNPILDAFERKKEKEFALRQQTHEEINMLSIIISADEAGVEDVGGLLFSYIETKMKLAKELVEDSQADPTLVYTKADLARRVQSVLSEEDWKTYQELFPLLRDYWR